MGANFGNCSSQRIADRSRSADSFDSGVRNHAASTAQTGSIEEIPLRKHARLLQLVIVVARDCLSRIRRDGCRHYVILVRHKDSDIQGAAANPVNGLIEAIDHNAIVAA